MRKATGKVSQTEIDGRLTQHELLWQGRIHNEIAKRIEREYLFPFSIPNYRSRLDSSYVEAWRRLFADKGSDASGGLDDRYARLEGAKHEELAAALLSFDPRSALEVDIVRETLQVLDSATVAHDDRIKALTEIVNGGLKYPRVKLKELIEPRFDKVRQDDYDGGLPIVEKIAFADGTMGFRKERETGMDLYRASKGDLVTSKINIHQGAVALAPCDLVASTHYQVYGVNNSEVNPDYLVRALRAFVWVIWVHLHDGSAFRFAPGSSSAPSTVDILRPEARTLAAG